METNSIEPKNSVEEPTFNKIIKEFQIIIDVAQETHNRTKCSLNNIKNLENKIIATENDCIDNSASVVNALFIIVRTLTDINSANKELANHLESII